MENRTPNPLVSVIMPAYNSRNTLADSIQSVVDQTFSDWELLIIDDCSKESMEDIADSFQDSRIRYVRLLSNSGVAKARNAGIAEARGRYIAFLDSDDLWLPKKLERQLDFMQTNQYAFTYTWYSQFTKKPSQPIRLVRTKGSVDYEHLLCGNDIGCLTVMIDHSQITEVFMPSERHEDYITWLNILKQGWKAYSLPEDLARYRKGKGSLTSNKWKSLIWTWRVYRQSQNFNVIKSGLFMVYYVYSGILKHYLNEHH